MPDGKIIDSSNEETVLLEETKFGDFQVKVTSGTATFFVDEPFGVGGLASGPNPYDLLGAALGSCTLMTIRLYANRKGWPLETVRVRVTHSRDGLDGRDVFTKAIELTGPLDDEQRARILEIAGKCPVQRTLTQGSDIHATLVPAAGFAATAATGTEHCRDMSEACAQNGAPA